ncbi:MAG: hypothetical protein LIO79_08925 [Rikenellaceae bacterium]|nr:hypothetical protein [Rikenellaceae bacterium]
MEEQKKHLKCPCCGKDFNCITEEYLPEYCPQCSISVKNKDMSLSFKLEDDTSNLSGILLLSGIILTFVMLL